MLNVPLETKRFATPRHFGRRLYPHTRTNIELVTRTQDFQCFTSYVHAHVRPLAVYYTYRNVVAQIVEVSHRLFQEFHTGIFWSKLPFSSSFFFCFHSSGARRSLINHCSVYNYTRFILSQPAF